MLSIKSKMLLMVVSLMTVTLLAVTFTSQKNFELEVEDLYQKLLRNSLHTVTQIIEDEYNDLVSLELAAIARRRVLMENMSLAVLSSLQTYYDLSKSGKMSVPEAQKITLTWLKHLRYGADQYFFVCNANLIGLGHPLTEMVGKEWLGFPDVKLQEAFPPVRAALRTRKHAYTVLSWPTLAGPGLVKQLGYFSYFSEWQWVIGTSVRLDDIEKDTQEKQETILKNLANIIPHLNFAAAGQFYLFDGKEKILISPAKSSGNLLLPPDDPSLPHRLRQLMEAARNFGKVSKDSAFSLGEKRYQHLTYAGYFKPLDWYVVLSIPQDALSAPVTNLITRQLYLILAILLVGVGSAIFISSKITDRLLALSNYAQELPRKNFTLEDTQLLNRIPLADGADEVGQLIKSFRFMETQLHHNVKTLAKSQEALENLVQERTSELVQVNEALKREIAERKLTEAALRENQERFRAFMDNSPTIAWAKDESGRYVFLSRTFEKRLGVRLEDWRGKTDFDFWPPDIAARLQEDDQAFLASGQTMEVCEQNIDPDDEGRYWWMCKFIFRDAGGGRYVGGIGLDITASKQAEELIQASLQEKEVLLKEIHHRTKNNLQVVCSLLKLQASRLEDLQLRRALQDTENRVRSMALVHEKLYQSNSLSHVDLKDYMKEIIYFLMTTYQSESERISLQLDLHSVTVSIETAMPCGLIVNELISNALKYAFPDGCEGTLSISLRPTEDDAIELRVADDGVGLPFEFDIRNTDSLGYKLVASLGENQLRGELEVRGDKGTEFRLRFREQDYKPRV